MGINEDQLQQIILLINKSINTELSAEEQQTLNQWLNMHKDNQTLFDELHDPNYRVGELQEMAQFTTEETALNSFLQKQRKRSYLKFKNNSFIIRITAAAVVAIVFSVALYLYNGEKTASHSQTTALQTDIAPGKNTAILTLNNGKTIKLSELKKGVIINNSGMVYDDGSPLSKVMPAPTNISMLTASTPRGGMYAFTLPDGTKAWLNSQSSLQFPSNFDNEPTRKVTLSGEAYFEVAKDDNQPFVVITKMQEVKVLGTHFNINAYADEDVSITTLLEGRIDVLNLKSRQRKQLAPNQEAIVSNASLLIKKAPSAENAIDWKNGDFILKEEKLENIMRKLSRWYDVEIVYSNKPQKPVILGGLLSRQKTLLAALRFIETTEKVRFEVEDRKVIVTYK
ncbi:FecR family protein [Pedobacter sp. UBA4863]|uniref:FecR family protein n=1 Tax=Pedobacter sp. UBA4863 TaxID=1947060 RepID=UPI0025DA8939|nr:FecR family protein [Pedobacter sp. UBA4863]